MPFRPCLFYKMGGGSIRLQTVACFFSSAFMQHMKDRIGNGKGFRPLLSLLRNFMILSGSYPIELSPLTFTHM